MRTRYKEPAVFKRDIYQKTPGDEKLTYAGEAQELCPKRLYGYLNPGPTQLANKKVNTEFRGYLMDNLKIKLDVCHIDDLTFGRSMLDIRTFTDKHVRTLVADPLVVEHGKRGFTVMDL
jgi:hypothetical protein